MDSFDPGPAAPTGLFVSLRALATTLVGIAHTRVALLGTELEEELARIVVLLIGAMVCLALFGLALLFGALLVVATLWDSHRIGAVASLAAGFLLLAVTAVTVLRWRVRRGAPLLGATLGELERDRHALSGVARD